VKSQSNALIRSELSVLRDRSLLKWKSAFESRGLTPIAFNEDSYHRIQELGKRLSSLIYLSENTEENMDFWAPGSVKTWGALDASRFFLEKLTGLKVENRVLPGKNFRAD